MYDYKVIAKEIKVFLSAEELFVYTPASEPLEIRNTFVWLIPRTARCMRRGEKECDGVSHVIVMPWRCARLRRKKTNCFFASFLFLWQHVSLDVLEWFCTLDFYLFFISIEKVVQRIHTGITSTTFLFFLSSAGYMMRWNSAELIFILSMEIGGRSQWKVVQFDASHFRTFDLSNST